jgi:D-proline reductase (dithiol) PrdB
MVRLSQFGKEERKHLLDLPCPSYTTTPFVKNTQLAHARLALVSTAGLHRRSDRPFGIRETGYRLIPKDVQASDLVMSHISTNFDRTGFQLDMNMAFPIDRLRELVEEKVIGSIAEYHYSFMGATPPEQMEIEARSLAAILKKDRVDAVLLVPV